MKLRCYVGGEEIQRVIYLCTMMEETDRVFLCCENHVEFLKKDEVEVLAVEEKRHMNENIIHPDSNTIVPIDS